MNEKILPINIVNVKKILSILILMVAVFFPLTNVYGSGSGSGSTVLTGVEAYEESLPYESVTGIIATIMEWLLGAVGFFGILGFLISGFMYLTAAGDDTQLKRAKLVMTSSIIGIIVALSGLIAVYAIFRILDASGTV